MSYSPNANDDTENDPYGSILRTASILGDYRRALLKEGFNRDEAFWLVGVVATQGEQTPEMPA